MIDFPREPNPGENLDASWGARVVRALRALFPMPGPGINVSTGPSGTTISSAAQPTASVAQPLDYFDCRILSDANGISHLCCYVPDTTYAVVVDQSRSGPATMSWFGNDGKWIDLGTISTNEDYIAYLGFVDAGVNEYPRWLWKVFFSSGSSGYMEPTMDASVVWTHPVVPICRLLDGELAQLHRGQLSVIGKWFVVGNNGVEARLTLRGTNGSDIAYIDDNDASPNGKSFALASGVPFSAPADATVGGDLTIGGKLNGEKPVWKTITIDGTSYTILCKAATRP